MSKDEKEIKEITKPAPKGPPKSVGREYLESFVVTLIMAIFGMLKNRKAEDVYIITVKRGQKISVRPFDQTISVSTSVINPNGKDKNA